MFKLFIQSSGVLFLLLVLTCCGDNEEDIPGSPPIADPGEYDSVKLGNPTTITLDGSNSSDPDGDTLTYEWRLVQAPEGSTFVNFFDTDKVRAFFTPDVEGEYIISLTVSDGHHPPVTEEVTIIILPPPNPPVADTGPDQTVNVNETVTLDGSGSSDPDGDPLTYNWAIASKPALSNVSITDKDKEMASFTPDRTGNYVIELTVTDVDGESDKDNVTVTAN